MRAMVSSALVVMLTATVGLHADGNDARTNLRASIESTAADFATSQSAADAAACADWSRLAKLPKATRVVIRTRDRRVTHATFVEADDASLTVLTGTLRRGFARAEIAHVMSDPKGSPAGAFIGATIGVFVGALLGGGLQLQCERHCSGSDNAGAALLLIGTPVGLGFAGYYEMRESPAVIYRAP